MNFKDIAKKKKLQRDFEMFFEFRKKNDARAIPRAARAYIYSVAQIVKYREFCPLWQNILLARAEVRARSKFLHHLILHKILHLLDTLNVSISLKLTDLEPNEVRDPRGPSGRVSVKKMGLL